MEKWTGITRVLRQLEQNGQVLRNPYNICKILVYSSFGKLKIKGDMTQNIKK